MTTIDPTWRKSTRSAQETNCVEVRNDLGAVQDTKHRGPHLTVDVAALIAAIRSGRMR
jgi:hypothetical protein